LANVNHAESALKEHMQSDSFTQNSRLRC